MKKEKINFSGVPEDIRERGAVHIPEGDYLCRIDKVEKRYKDDDKTNVPYFQWVFKIIDGKHKGTSLYYTTSLKPEALWNLRNLIWAASDGKKNVAGKAISFDPEGLLKKRVGVAVEDEEYKDKIRSRAVAVMPPSEMEEGEEDEEDEDEEEEEEEDEDLEEVDFDEEA